MDWNPSVVSLVAWVLITAYQTLDGIDGIHAVNNYQAGPLGEFFSRCCNNVSFIFSTLSVCAVVGFTDLETQWYLVQIAALLSLVTHIDAFKTKVTRFSIFTGPGEGIFILQTLLVIKGVFGFDLPKYLLKKQLDTYLPHLLSLLSAYTPYQFSMDDPNIEALTVIVGIRFLYYGMTIYCLVAILSLGGDTNYATRNGLLITVAYRIIPSVLYSYGLWSPNPSPLEIISAGMFVSVVASDMILAKMADRQLHPYIVIFTMMSLVNSLLTLVMIGFYFTAVFFELSEYMQISLFSVVKNVYVDGVYDLFHLGHINAMKQALSYGTRLFVGVLSDEAVAAYKRAPVMTMKERAAAIRTCKYVHKVIENCPGTGIPEEFIRKYNIHLVCHSPEYDTEDDIYYKVPRALGIAQVTTRTEGVSTSTLIKRILANADSLSSNKQTGEGVSKPSSKQKSKATQETPKKKSTSSSSSSSDSGTTVRRSRRLSTK
eukprot:TRINITY_DN2204_c0_g1_i1.p1 TRINITY_DN2204_c0_g1~~TRINITY_DN2204_c0_g1_i1.p1  ORF type:complete len:546 (+),score=76.90 TRINITY_DN2204_c0_g1_i1:181-1638(+)